LTPLVEVEVEVVLGVLRETDILDLVPERLLRLDIKIFLSSAEILDSCVLPLIPAAVKIATTWSGVFFSSLESASTLCAISIIPILHFIDYCKKKSFKPSSIFSGRHNDS
jgi:hypothetical protein